jgi:hypothetical protein
VDWIGRARPDEPPLVYGHFSSSFFLTGVWQHRRMPLVRPTIQGLQPAAGAMTSHGLLFRCQSGQQSWPRDGGRSFCGRVRREFPTIGLKRGSAEPCLGPHRYTKKRTPLLGRAGAR